MPGSGISARLRGDGAEGIHAGHESREWGDSALDSLFGFDIETGTLQICSLANMAETHDHHAFWSDETTLNGRCHRLRRGKRFLEDFTIRLMSPDEMTIDYGETLDVQFDSSMGITLKRHVRG